MSYHPGSEHAPRRREHGGVPDAPPVGPPPSSKSIPGAEVPPARLGADFLEQRRAASSAPGVGLLEPGKRGDVERHGSELRANLAEL